MLAEQDNPISQDSLWVKDHEQVVAHAVQQRDVSRVGHAVVGGT